MIFILVLAAVFSGCAGMEQDKPQEYYQDLRQQYDAARTKQYLGVDEETVRQAIVKLFTLADDDYTIIFGERGVIAHREYGFNDLKAGVKGDFWYATLYPSASGVTIRVRCAPEPDPATPLDTEILTKMTGTLVRPETIDPRETTVTELEESFARYMIFFKRMDFLLNRNDYWLYCRAAQEYVRMEKQPGNLDPVCLNAADLRPGGRAVR